MNRARHRHAFTLIELIAVIVVLAVLAGVALPRYFDYSSQARESACRGIMNGVRTGVANFRANSAIAGTPAYPTLVQLDTIGTVMQEEIPENPYNQDKTVRDADGEYDPAAAQQTVSGTAGWAYDQTAGRFWANSNTTGENGW